MADIGLHSLLEAKLGLKPFLNSNLLTYLMYVFKIKLQIPYVQIGQYAEHFFFLPSLSYLSIFFKGNMAKCANDLGLPLYYFSY